MPKLLYSFKMKGQKPVKVYGVHNHYSRKAKKETIAYKVSAMLTLFALMFLVLLVAIYFN
jgi:hypothetical protein